MNLNCAVNIRSAEKFVSCRVGLELHNYNEDLKRILKCEELDGLADFIVTPLVPPKYEFYHNNQDTEDMILLPDLAVSHSTWENYVAVSINHLNLIDDIGLIEKFDRYFRHALYLPAGIVVINCPDNERAISLMSDIINRRLIESRSEKLILFRVDLNASPDSSKLSSASSSPCKGTCFDCKKIDCVPLNERINPPQASDSTSDESVPQDQSGSLSDQTDNDKEQSKTSNEFIREGWVRWTRLTTYLNPDIRIGVCLVVNEDLGDVEYHNKWAGEPVRMVVISSDRFSSVSNFKNSIKIAGNLREFLRSLAVANSLKTSFVLQSNLGHDIKDHLRCLSNFCDMLHLDHEDSLRAWNDRLLCPLQPLSTNLDAQTYQIFECDSAKYSGYHNAMLEALDCLMMRQGSKDREKFIMMVLGAGRGPLVEAMIRAIHKLNIRGKIFKIYALDKNFSSIGSLRYRKRTQWDQYQPQIEVEVVEADMRYWQPGVIADIIATELLGSFSDNELSPECIDGAWRFSSAETISIPQSYSSFVAPITAYRLRQQMYDMFEKSDIFDQIQVARLSNIFTISPPQKLFTFEHHNLSQEPEPSKNERHAIVRFRASCESICHGFAGYFSSTLFGNTKISTVPETKTQNMESWFPAFIPLEKPVYLFAGSLLEVEFSRKESNDKVWYEWQVLKPEPSKIHSLDGKGSSMSKIV